MQKLESWFTRTITILGLVLGINLASPALGLTPIATLGEIDLRHWQPNDPLSLDGEWHFFWKEQLTPAQAVNRIHATGYQPFFAKIGTRFRSIAPNSTKDDLGYATYVLVLRNLPDASMALTALSAYTAAELFLFSEDEAATTTALASHGRFGTTAETTTPTIAMSGLVNFRVKPAPLHYIVIHVANYHYVWGGLWLAPIIGTENAIFKTLQATDRSNYAILGMFIIIFFYNLSFYLRRREDKASLFLACFVAVAIIRSYQLARWSDPIFSDLYLSFEISLKLIFMTIAGFSCTFFLFLRACFPKQTPRWAIRYAWVASATPFFIVLLTPGTLYGHFSEINKLCAVSIAILAFYVMTKAARAREEGANVSLLGGAFLIAGAMMDMAFTLGVRDIPTNSTGIGLVIFVACQSQIIAVRFAVAFRKSEHLSRSLADEVDMQTRDIKSILNNIRQGIFTIVHPLKRVGDQHSDHLVSLLGKTQITGQTLDDLLLRQSDLSSDRKSQIQAALDASLGENVLAFEVNEASFVHEMRYSRDPEREPQILEIDWNPILNKQDEVEKILVSLRDVTEMRSLKEDAEKREEDMKIIIELIKIPEEKFQRFLTKANEYLAENRDLILKQDAPRSEVVKRLFMNMHTIKGAARTYFLHAISTAAHDAEQYYATLQRQDAEWDHDRLVKDLDEVGKVMSHYQEVGEDRLGWSQRNTIIKVDRSKLAENLQYLEALDLTGMGLEQRHQIAIVIARLSGLCFDSLTAIVDEASRGLDSIARDLNKETPHIAISVNRVLLKEQGSEVLYNVLIHLFRNSMDHGIEVPAVRLQRGKSSQGHMKLEVTSEANHLALTFQDDGNGLDLNSIKAKGLDRSLLLPDRVYTDQEIASLIFVSGFSTRSSVSEISGRGVGLDAVNSYCKGVGAMVAIKLEPSSDRSRVPFCLEITLPKQLFWEPQSLESNGLLAS